MEKKNEGAIAAVTDRIQAWHVLLFITLAGFLIRLWYAQADPFLHDWDERFHALVARNMMQDPFTPLLKARPYDTLDPYWWCCNHVWLHKQPLFLWQMALSMKIFGTAEWAFRLPSVIMGTLMIPILYRLGYLLTGKHIPALLAAAMLSFSHYHLIMISGIKGMDHNDVAMGFYVLASLGAFAEYRRSGKIGWAIALGLFAGCAVLNKWLIGLAAFLGWGIYIAATLRKKGTRREILHFALALLTCCAVFVPWQLYILHRWPDLAHFEYEYNTRHIFEAVEGHAGGIWYYFQLFPQYFGDYLWPFLFIGLPLALFGKSYDKALRICLLSIAVFVFCFFSFVVQTKISNYMFFIVPVLMLFIGIAIYQIYHRLNRQVVLIPTFLLLAAISFDPREHKAYFADKDGSRQRKLHNTAIYKDLKKTLPPDIKFVINLGQFEDVELMYYQNDLTANSFWLKEEDLAKLEKKKMRIATFMDHGNYILPDFVRKYPYLYIIEQPLQ